MPNRQTTGAALSVAIAGLIMLLAGCQLTIIDYRPQPTLPLPTPLERLELTVPPAATATAAATAVVAPPPSPSPSPTASPSPPPTASPPPATRPPIASGPHFLGYSYGGHPIERYQFGRGPRQLIFVGGIHGGYEWNTILLAYQVVDYFQAAPEQLPPAVTLHIIPSANPDGQVLVTGRPGRFTPADLAAATEPGRFNGRGVDLNRNWDCQWAPTALWRSRSVSGGDAPFSEPENQILRDFFLQQAPELVLFWHSAANGVFAAGCPATDPISWTQAQLFAQAAGYPAYQRFDAYAITGDASDWLASQGIPSITVELTSHQALDWPANLAGIQALLAQYEADQPLPNGD